MIEGIIIVFIVVFTIFYMFKSGDSMYKFVIDTSVTIYERYTPYSFRVIREKVKEMGLEYSTKQYLVQIVTFAGAAFAISYLYFYNPMVSVVYMIIVVSVIPYLTYLRCKRIYSLRFQMMLKL